MSTPSSGHVVGISISRSPDLAQLGYGQVHMHERMIAIARAMLRLGRPGRPVHLVYGGDLRPSGFTDTLLDLARAESVTGDQQASGDAASDADGDSRGRVFSYLAWPYYSDLTKAFEAQHLNVCTFIRITPRAAGLDKKTYPDDLPASSLDKGMQSYVKARCMCRLREAMTEGGCKTFDDDSPRLTARIILGGKTANYSGIMPGIFEEFMLAQKAGCAVYLVSEFGGAGKALADAALSPPDQALPAVFTLDYHRDNSRGYKELEQVYTSENEHATLEQRFADLHDALLAYRRDLHGDDSHRCRNGLTRRENRDLMQSRDISEIVGLIERGLKRVATA